MPDINLPYYVAVFALTFLLTVVIERVLIPRLIGRAEQPIYEDGPKWHKGKSGTPTMGGVAFLIAVTVALLLSALFLYLGGNSESAAALLLSLGYAVANSAVGIIDDLKKLKKKENAGLKPREKLLLQTLFSVLFLVGLHLTVQNPTLLSFSFGVLDIGIFYYPLALIILVGITNCANLTDGIDGLASGVAFAIGIMLFYISCALCTEVCFISAALMGATTGFLVFNLHPARVFMGDTGSLFLGAIVAASCFALGNMLVAVFVGAVYVIEGVSVILQVLWFKLTNKRLFKMAPLHHHLEKCGWSENRICIVAIIFTLICSLPALALYLP